ncbi:MAG: hypothetical protein IPK42_00070 [Betaproteobacteria bacterium]|nr:hypothetical protein [Betaproteobacteria bacterium]
MQGLQFKPKTVPLRSKLTDALLCARRQRGRFACVRQQGALTLHGHAAAGHAVGQGQAATQVFRLERGLARLALERCQPLPEPCDGIATTRKVLDGIPKREHAVLAATHHLCRQRQTAAGSSHHGLVRQHPLHGPDAGLQSFALRPGLRDTLRHTAVEPCEPIRCLPILRAQVLQGAITHGTGAGQFLRQLRSLALDGLRLLLQGHQ